MDGSKVFCLVHVGGKLVRLSCPGVANNATHVYAGGNQHRFVFKNDSARDCNFVLNSLFVLNKLRRDCVCYFEVVPTDGGTRTIRRIQDDHDSAAFALQGKRVAFMNVYVCREIEV